MPVEMFCLLKIELFPLFNFESSLHILNIQYQIYIYIHTLDIWFANIFTPSIVCLNTFLLVFWSTKFYILMHSNLLTFSFIVHLASYLRNLNQCHKDLILYFLLTAFLFMCKNLSILPNLHNLLANSCS